MVQSSNKDSIRWTVTIFSKLNQERQSAILCMWRVAHAIRKAYISSVLPALADDRLTCSSAVLPPYSFCLIHLQTGCVVQDAAVTKTEVRFIHSHEDQFLIPSLDSGFRESYVSQGLLLLPPLLFFSLLFSTPPVFSLNTKSLLQGGMFVNYNLFTYYALNLISPA